MAAGKVCTGFSDPFVAKYNYAGGKVSYTAGMRLARGVKISISPEVADDNIFYADNVAAESDAGIFTGGVAKLTVDGLLQAAERFIFGLPEPTEVAYGETGKAMMIKHGINVKPPYLGIGIVVRYQSTGITTYVPTILVKTKFKTNGTEAATQEEKKNWQTQELEAALFRDDSADADWKWIGEDLATQEEAVNVIKGIFAVESAGEAG